MKLNKIKTFIISIAFLISGFILGSCGEKVLAAQEYPLKIWKHNENGHYETLCIVDENTGVNYIVVSGGTYNNNTSVTITPRLNADGTLYLSD